MSYSPVTKKTLRENRDAFCTIHLAAFTSRLISLKEFVKSLITFAKLQSHVKRIDRTYNKMTQLMIQEGALKRELNADSAVFELREELELFSN